MTARLAAAPGLASALGRLAGAVDADAGAHLYVDRGDGVLELAASVSGAAPLEVTGSGPAALGTASSMPASASYLHLPDERGGLLILERWRAEPFTEDDLAIARVQARRLVTNVATRLGPRPIAWSIQLDAVQAVAAQLTRLSSVEDVTRALCSQTQRVVAFDNARVYVLRDDGRTLDPVAWRPQADEYQGETVEGLRVTLGEGITGWVASTGQPLNVPDAGADPRAIDVPGSLDLDEESMLLAPLRSEGRVMGVVVLSRLGLARFSDDELRLLGVLADLAAVAIENAHLMSERDRHVRELEALLDISRAGDGMANERELATLLAGKLRDAAGMDACLVWRWDQHSGDLVPAGAAGQELPNGPADLVVDRAARQVLITDSPLWLDAWSGQEIAVERTRLSDPDTRAVLLMPLSIGGRVVGLADLRSRQTDRQFHAGEIAWLRTMANQAAGALENANLVRQLRDAAETDPVTGVYSHRHLQDRIRQETARAARSRSTLSVLMVDLDDFKRVNDIHGHQAGDRVLRTIAGALRAAVRTSDVVARYGGDEFVVLMPDTDAEEASHVAARAREAVAAQAHLMADGSTVHVTCSAGLALCPRDGTTARGLLRGADAAMYTQKRARGRVAVTSGPSGDPGALVRGPSLSIGVVIEPLSVPAGQGPGPLGLPTSSKA